FKRKLRHKHPKPGQNTPRLKETEFAHAPGCLASDLLGAARLSSNVTRRNFLKTSATAGAGLLLPFHIAGHAGNSKNSGPLATAPFSPNAWLELSPGGDIKIWCVKAQLGQAVRTAL